MLTFVFSFIFYLDGKKGNFYVVTGQTEPRFKSHDLCNWFHVLLTVLP